MLFREHRGTLADSMATAIPLASDKQSLVKYINGLNLFLDNRNIGEEEIIIESYGFDERINWDTYIVRINGYGVVGFTNMSPV